MGPTSVVLKPHCQVRTTSKRLPIHGLRPRRKPTQAGIRTCIGEPARSPPKGGFSSRSEGAWRAIVPRAFSACQKARRIAPQYRLASSSGGVLHMRMCRRPPAAGESPSSNGLRRGGNLQKVLIELSSVSKRFSSLSSLTLLCLQEGLDVKDLSGVHHR